MQNLSATSTIGISPDYSSYIMDPNQYIVSQREGGRGKQITIVQYQDGTEWVYLSDKQKERFCGFLYLQDVIQKANEQQSVAPAQNRMALHQGKIIYLSRYCGETKPEFFKYLERILVLAKIGFTDTGQMANLRVQNNILYVFDTEQNSFAPETGEKLHAFEPLHDAIRADLEKRLV